MTTRAVLTGLGLGLLLSGVLFYPLHHGLPRTHLYNWESYYSPVGEVLVVLAAVLAAEGGGLAADWSRSPRPWQRLLLGALAGGLAGMVVFGSLGAAAGGAVGLSPMISWRSTYSNYFRTPAALLQTAIWTYGMFWVLAGGGALLGLLGSLRSAWAARRSPGEPAEDNPQMALNASITALPSTAVALALAVGLYSPLLDALLIEAGSHENYPPFPLHDILNWPVATALLLYLAAQLALTLVTIHEARQSEHRCGIDEVKMAAYVGIFVPILLVALGLLNWRLVLSPVGLGCLLLSLGMVMRQVVTLFTIILPRRSQMPPPADRLEAVFFGIIAKSRWQSLLVLCLGCGVMLAAPLYVAVSGLINLAVIPALLDLSSINPPGVRSAAQADLVQRLYGVQAAAGLGSSAAAALLLAAVYMLYLRIGKAFRRLRTGTGFNEKK
jgi:hypothetical protein